MQEDLLSNSPLIVCSLSTFVSPSREHVSKPEPVCGRVCVCVWARVCGGVRVCVGV